MFAAVAQWQRHLSDVGGRNTLLWYQDLPTGTLDLTSAHPGGVSMLLAGRRCRLSDLVREQAALSEARIRARAIRAKAVSLTQQRGLVTSFLAIGMAGWELPGVSRSPQAPVLLRSCTLRPIGTAADDFELDLGDEVELNPVLENYLSSELGITIDAVALAEMSRVSTGFDPYPVYAGLERLCRSVPGFAISPRLVVATFPHAKLDMVADLAEQREQLAAHDGVAAIAGDPQAERTVRDTTPDPQTEVDPDPHRERLVLDADSGQAGVVDAVRRGASLVVHAAPGTGATQTIANLVAALASDGRSVLLVAEARSAITGTIERLDQVGLGELVLDAARAAVDRRELLQRIVADLDVVAERDSQRPGDKDYQARQAAQLEAPDLERLIELRDRLRDHVEALHEVRQPWGVSAYEAQWAIAELGSRDPAPASRVRLDGSALTQLSRARLAELAQQLSDAAQIGAWSADPGADPWYGAHITTEADAERAADLVTGLSVGGFDKFAEILNGILEESSLPPARAVADWAATLRTMSGVRNTLEVFRPEIFDVPLDEHVAATGTREFRAEHGVTLGAWARSRVRRQARAMLRPGRPPADLHAELMEARRQRQAWNDLVGAGGRPEISPRLDEAQAAFDLLNSDLIWLGTVLASTADGGALQSLAIPQLKQRLRDLAARLDRLAVLPKVVPVIDELRESGMGAVVDDFAHRAVPGEQVTPELEHIWWVSLARHITDADARYGQHDGTDLRATLAEYAAIDRHHIDATAEQVQVATDRIALRALAAHRQEAAMLRAESTRSGRPRAIRSLLAESAELLLAVKPCWAMSPLAVAEVVPGGPLFDVVIIDGASQLAPAEAITAISRGRQVVAFGDRNQPPPTSFSTAVTPIPSLLDDEPQEVPPAPSVFDALAGILPARTLGWSYGPLDERLIGFANREAYGGSLLTFPGTGAHSPVVLDLVEGSARVEPGQKSAVPSTETEVARVVELVLEHARTHPEQSLGVVTITPRHAQLISTALGVARGRSARRGEESTDDFFEEDQPEPFFILPMDELAGEVRDAVILSIGYAKTPHGRVIHSFPSLAAPGAERMLTTATTRARFSFTVVSALTADDLDPDRLRSHGAQLLRELLDYAARGGSDAQGAQRRARDPLMADLAERLRREGLSVVEDAGSSVTKVDLVIADPDDPDRYLVAVEGDGPGYAGLAGTRERDRLWVEQLERLGWKHVRIFSTDLYRDPAREVARVVAATKEHADVSDENVDEGVEGSDESVGTGPGEQGEPVETRASRKAKKKRRIGFRKSTAEQSLDDTDVGWGERVDDSAHDRWLREQRPPHWD